MSAARGAARGAVRRLLAAVAAAVALTLASSAVERTRLEVQDWDCPPAPASCARPVLVLGWPLPYVSDYHGISVVGRASVFGALLGEDRFHPAPFAADVALHGAMVAAVWAVVGRFARRRTR